MSVSFENHMESKSTFYFLVDLTDEWYLAFTNSGMAYENKEIPTILSAFCYWLICVFYVVVLQVEL